MALVEAARFADSFEAGMARARLEAEGILSILFGLDSSPAFAGGMFNIRLMVDEAINIRAHGAAVTFMSWLGATGLGLIPTLLAIRRGRL